MSRGAAAGRAGVHALATASGAFLLFLVQPLAAQTILPEFGGAPSVWTLSMLFFQAVLLGGYAYAHVLATRLRRSTQGHVHVAVVLVAVAYAIWTATTGGPDGGPTDGPAGVLLRISLLLGPPFFALSATAPLVQSWFAHEHGHRSPYHLYALSNAGSLFALLAYPFLLEPWCGLRAQRIGWTVGLVLFSGVMAVCALRRGSDDRAEGRAPTTPSDAVPLSSRLLWIGLPCATSVLLLAITNELTQNVAVLPFLWLAPLALYLTSYIVSFSGRYSPSLFRPLALLCVLLLGRTNWSQIGTSFMLDVGLWCMALFVVCTACHGELARLKPHATQLTSFYLAIALGGAAGGVFVGIIAPQVFVSFAELWVGIAGAVALIAVCIVREAAADGTGLRRFGPSAAFVVGALAIGGVLAGVRTTYERIAASRSFLGVLEVVEYRRGDIRMRVLHHGATVHGAQFDGSVFRFKPISYYGPGTAVELVFDQYAKRSGRRIATIGMGVGTVAAYAEPGDEIRFYEIDSDVVDLAWSHFTFLEDCAGEVSIAIGDARIVLESEEPNGFDILLLDAFSGASPPSHLLTLEAFEEYARHLVPGGVLLVHVSNNHFDLIPVALGAGAALGMQSAVFSNEENQAHETYASTWVVLTRDLVLLENPTLIAGQVELDDDLAAVVWTDDRHSLLPLTDW